MSPGVRAAATTVERLGGRPGGLRRGTRQRADVRAAPPHGSCGKPSRPVKQAFRACAQQSHLTPWTPLVTRSTDAPKAPGPPLPKRAVRARCVAGSQDAGLKDYPYGALEPLPASRWECCPAAAQGSVLRAGRLVRPPSRRAAAPKQCRPCAHRTVRNWADPASQTISDISLDAVTQMGHVVGSRCSGERRSDAAPHRMEASWPWFTAGSTSPAGRGH
jgi:hypothetical protein